MVVWVSHVRVGNRQASNKTKAQSKDWAFVLLYLLFADERSPEQDKSAGSGFERCAATAGGCGQDARHHSQASNKTKAQRKTGLFVFAARRAASSPVALRLPGYRPRSPEKVRSTASGESSGHINVNERPSRVTGPFVFLATEPKERLQAEHLWSGVANESARRSLT